MGLCFGGGQLGLGLIALALAFLVLTVLKEVEKRVAQDRRATVRLKLAVSGPSDREIQNQFTSQGLHIASLRVSYDTELKQREVALVVHWRSRPIELQPPVLIEELAERAGVLAVEWATS
jgi:putative Mg2+ transporter-C (MgtC) family protein